MNAAGTLRRGWNALTRHQEWNIGLVDAPVTAFLDPEFSPEIHWLPAPAPGKFVADPFVFMHSGVPYVLYEDFNIRRERGQIATCRVTEDLRTEACGPVLSLDTHLAYPFVFEWEDAIYCIPESAGEREIALYRLERIPGALTKIRTLVPDIAAVDPTLFEFEGRWWLACTDQVAGSNEALSLFHADSPLGPWRAHARNPVKRDTASTRPAGTPFLHEGILYRPAQDCSRTYGGRIAINRIDSLTPDSFAEQTVRWIEPDPTSVWKDGIHTLNGVGGLTVVDGKRERLIPSAVLAAVRRNIFRGRQKRTGATVPVNSPAPAKAGLPT